MCNVVHQGAVTLYGGRGKKIMNIFEGVTLFMYISGLNLLLSQLMPCFARLHAEHRIHVEGAAEGDI